MHDPVVEDNHSKTDLFSIKLAAVGGGWGIVYISAIVGFGTLQLFL